MIVVPLVDLKFLNEIAAGGAGTSNRRHYPTLRGSAAGGGALATCALVAVGDAAWWSMVFGSGLAGSASVFSSSDRPFLKDLMPLAKSPISSEILPRPPNNRSPTASTMIQCQILIEPMRYSSASTGAHARPVSLRRETRLRTGQKQGLHGIAKSDISVQTQPASP